MPVSGFLARRSDSLRLVVESVEVGMRALLAAVGVLGALAIGVPARAQYHGDDAGSGELAGRLRFNVELPLFRYASLSQSIEVAGMEESSSVSVVSIGGPGALMLDNGGIGFGLGYAVIDSIVIGTGITLGYDSMSFSEMDDATSSALFVNVAPYFEYVGGDASTKPFVGLALPLRHLSRTTEILGEEDKESQTLLGVGLIGGAHFFASSGCSIDLTGKLSYSSVVSSDPELADGQSLSMIDFLVTLGISAWIL